MTFRKLVLLLVTGLLAVAWSAAASAQDYWRKVITPDRYKRMSQFERVQYNKAFELLTKGQYRAAANEFERFRIQYKDSEVLPYIVFLQAFSLHQAKDRNKAISVYNEVIDFFGGEIEAAAPAMYYKGRAQFDNGDYTKGMTTMKELLDDEDYKRQPVAASASLDLVWNYWKSKEPDKANIYLKKIFNQHRKTSPDAATNAKRYYMAACASTGNMQEYSSWYMKVYEEEAEDKHIKSWELRTRMVNEMYDLICGMWWQYFQNNDLMLKYRAGKKGPDPMIELWKLLQDNQKNYEKSDKMWDFYFRSVNLMTQKKVASATQFDKTINDMIALIKKTPDDERHKGRQQQRFSEIVELLFRNGRPDHAGYVNANIKDDKVRSWNDYRVSESKGQWQDCLDKLEQMMAKFKAESDFVSRCMWSKARILRDKVNKVDDAIKVYQEISQPPATLWELAHCYKLKKDHKMVIQKYIEIENSFTNAAPQAAWARCEYCNQIGEQKRSIAEARRILKVYPKHQQASWAHQHLERLGVDETGLGAGVDDDF